MKPVAMEPLTVEDYRLLPETGPRYQLIEGDLYMAPAPNRYHQDISLNLTLFPEVRQIHVYFLQKDPERAAATRGENDTFASPHFPGLKIKGAAVFKR